MAGDIDRVTRVRGYTRALARYPGGTAALSLLNLAMRMAGPREALWHAIIRRNHGCTHFIVGRDRASPGPCRNGRAFHGPYDAQACLAAHEDELGIAMVPFQELVYVENRARHLPADRVTREDRVRRLSSVELRRRLRLGLDIPERFTFPEVADELRRACPPRHRQGFTVLSTGLSGAGKSTLAKALAAMLRECAGRRVTLLDGDVVRNRLSSELGFSREHRQTDLRRFGFVAAEIARHSGIAICAPIEQPDRWVAASCTSPLAKRRRAEKPNGLNMSHGMSLRRRQLSQSGSPQAGGRFPDGALCREKTQNMSPAHGEHDKT